MRHTILVLIAGLGLTEPLLAAPPETGSAGDLRPCCVKAAEHTEPLDRVVVIGASASAGFGVLMPVKAGEVHRAVPIRLAPVVDAAITIQHEPVRDHADIMFFTNPLAIGSRQIEAALQAQPTLIIAVDFLFWYGYGYAGPDGGRMVTPDKRVALLKKGLEQLERVTCPVVVGDFPDMSAAIGKMLGAGQVPTGEARDALNQHLREWAEARENVIVLPLDELTRKLVADEAFAVGAHEWSAGSRDRLLQADQLHPTVEGLIAIAQQVAHELTEHGTLGTPEAPALELDVVDVKEKIEDRVREQIEAERRPARRLDQPADVPASSNNPN